MMSSRKQQLLAVLTAILCLIAGIAIAEEGVFELPSSMKTIKAEAFYGADWLTEVKLPSGVQTIGSKAFAYSGLKYIHLPASLTSIADDVFTGCSGIRVTAAAGSYAYDWAVRNGYIIEVEPLSISATADTKTIITGETRPSGTFTITGGVAPYSVTYGWYADGYEYPQQVNYADLATAASADWEFEPCSNTEGTFRVEFTCVDSEGNEATYTLSGFQMQEPEPDDSISVSSSSTSSPYTVTVVSSGSWKATSNASWLTLSKTSGSAGTSTVKVTAAANTTGYDRTGKVTFTCGSATDTFTVTQEGVLATPTNFRATLVESGLVRLSWNAVTGAEEYKVYYGYSADDLSSYEYVTGTTVDIAVLTIASKAYFQVRAVNSDDVSDKTEILEVTLKEEQEPYVIVKLSSSSITLTQSATYTLTCDVQSNTTTHSPVWTSSNTSVATVSSSGVVKAVGEGTAVITCSVTGDGVTGKATCTVKVNGWVMPPTPTPTVSPTSTPVPTVQPYLDVTLSDTKITLDVGDTYTLACSVNTNVTAHSPVWTSSNTSVATVSSSGKVTAVGAGTATITCSVSGNGVSDSATCKVTVTEPFVPEYINVTLNKTTLTLEVGDYDYLSETVDTNLSDYSTAWKSSNTSVAKVSTSGKVTAVSKGTATITCTVSGNGESDSATCKVTVVDSGCTFDVSTNSWSPSYSTATTTIDLTLHSGHSYTVDVAQYNSEGKLCDDSKTTSSDNKLAEWLTVTENSTSVKLAAEAHYAVNSRKATVTVSCDCGEAEYDITVQQSGGAPKPASVSLTMAGGGGFTETSTTIDTTIHDHTNYKLLPGDTFGATVSTGSYARRVTIRIKPLSNSYNVWESYTTTTGSSGISKTFSCTLPDDLEPGVYKVDVYAANSTVAGSDSQYIQVSAKFTVVGGTPDWDEMIDNLCSSSYVGGKAAVIRTVAERFMEEGYEPTFIAGVCANVLEEGSFGLFEGMDSSTYNKYAYHKYMIDNYNYTKVYSYKRIYNGFSLSAVRSLLTTLQNGGWQGGFGLGMCQWTWARTITLVDNYIEEAWPSDTITYDQCIVAEFATALEELNGNYRSVYTNWKSNNSGSLDSLDAAYDAGYRFCYYYERPASYASKSVTRGNLARNLYAAMLGQ